MILAVDSPHGESENKPVRTVETLATYVRPKYLRNMLAHARTTSGGFIGIY